MQSVLIVIEGKDYSFFMPRSDRLDAPCVLHHAMGRGIEGLPISLTHEGRNEFVLKRYGQKVGI